MITREVTYKDFNGVERTEKLYFHLNRAECIEFLASVDSFSGSFKNMVFTIKDLILKSYGEPDLDGRRFIKSKEKYEEFYQTEAYSTFYMELVNDPAAMEAFINGIIPEDLRAKLDEDEKN